MTLRNNDNNNEVKFIDQTISRKLIYVYEKEYAEEQGYIKIGEASIDKFGDLTDNSPYLKQMAEKRIREYEKSSPINILYAIYAADNQWKRFSDKDVHAVMRRSGYPQLKRGTSIEWFKASPEVAMQAINAVKDGLSAIKKDASSISKNLQIKFRPDQARAIKQSLGVFKTRNEMLWNAKMRFGKTLCALQVVKEMQFKKTLVVTHRPIVGDGWFQEFNKIFAASDYVYGSKQKGWKIEDLCSQKFNQPFVYFASMQDLRGSSAVNDETGIDKNAEIFNVNWDFIIIDEAHEGTTTELAKRVKEKITSDETKWLELSGTPFNLVDKYDESQVFTWDYVSEQEAKANWDPDRDGGRNPYADLPSLEMYVYSLDEYIKNEEFIEDKSFNFAEFFRTNDEGKFVYENYIWEFLNLITRLDKHANCKTNMPFSNEEFRNQLRHTLWTLPSRKSSIALEQLLRKHPIFRYYKIANLSDDNNNTEADIKKIRDAITDHPEENYSITLTVRKATVGVTVKEWTGILVLNNTDSATQYLQSIFRVQSPYSSPFGQKEKAYVFDFAPDRTLKMVAEAVKLNTKAGSLNNKEQYDGMKQLLNFLPIIGMDVTGTKMERYSVEKMLSQLKRAQAERAVRNGFDDASIYNNELLKLDDLDLRDFEKLRGIIGVTKQTKKLNVIDINNQGLSDEEYDASERGLKKPKKERTQEELDAIAKRNTIKKRKEELISILRGISIRIPLMIYGMDLDKNEKITIDNFVELVDDESWKEFMPKGVDKTEFNKFKRYYDPDVFSEASHRIRQVAHQASKLSIEERIQKITELFSHFKNPDKETVLTPWRVVNMHLGDCLGGYNFFDEEYKQPLVYLDQTDVKNKTRYIEKDEITQKIFHKDAKVLEINSKTGLYPLYVAYSIYKRRWFEETPNWDKSGWDIKERALWQQVLENNIYVLCKTPMAKIITYRTLYGYESNAKLSTNIIYKNKLMNKIRNNIDDLSQEILKNFGAGNMKFDAVVGNPPYQENDNGQRDDNSINASATALYPSFFNLSKKLSKNLVSLIFPARWLSGAGKGISEFHEEMINDRHIRNMKIIKNSSDIFPNASISGGILYITYDKSYDGMSDNVIIDEDGSIQKFKSYLNSCDSNIFIPYVEMQSVLIKIKTKCHLAKNNISHITSELKQYGLRTDLFKDPSKYNLEHISETRKKSNDIEIIGRSGAKRVSRYISKNYEMSVRERERV